MPTSSLHDDEKRCARRCVAETCDRGNFTMAACRIAPLAAPIFHAAGDARRTMSGRVDWIDWLAVMTSTIAIVYVGSAFYRSAFAALRHRTSNMDTLIAMGTSVAYGYSAVALVGFLTGAWHALPDLYFMEAGGLLALISLGHAMEAGARDAAGGAIRALLHLAPSTALRLSQGSNEPQQVPVAALHVNDRVLIRPGDRVPIDGIVTDGNTSVDESLLTGEPLPASRTVGDDVFGGTINQDGRIVIRATKVGADTALSQIIRLVEAAQDGKPPVQRLADRIAAVFVPSVLVIALVTAVGWFCYGHLRGWESAVTWAAIAKSVCSVLIIACPCALGLAVPAAILVGTGGWRAAGNITAEYRRASASRTRRHRRVGQDRHDHNGQTHRQRTCFPKMVSMLRPSSSSRRRPSSTASIRWRKRSSFMPDRSAYRFQIAINFAANRDTASSPESAGGRCWSAMVNCSSGTVRHRRRSMAHRFS